MIFYNLNCWYPLVKRKNYNSNIVLNLSQAIDFVSAIMQLFSMFIYVHRSSNLETALMSMKVKVFAISKSAKSVRSDRY